MKFTSVLLMVCILLLSSLAGMVNGMQYAAKSDCCKHMDARSACHHPQKPNKTDDCSQPGCAMLFTCSMCGFIVVEPLRINPSFATYLSKPILPYKIGRLTGYHTLNFKPPKIV